MNNTKNFFVINEESRLERWTLLRQEMNITEAVIDPLTAGMSRICKDVMPMTVVSPDVPGNVSLSAMANGQRMFSMPVFKMSLNTRFAPDSSGVLTPVFEAGDGPTLPIFWVPPGTMKLVLSIILGPKFENLNQYLTAHDKTGRLWRLPVSNLYQDCRLCPGTANYLGSQSCLSSLQVAWEQFRLSKWNSDLYVDSSPARRKATERMFRFKPSDAEFIQLPLDGDWTDLCEKVGHEFLKNNVVPH